METLEKKKLIDVDSTKNYFLFDEDKDCRYLKNK